MNAADRLRTALAEVAPALAETVWSKGSRPMVERDSPDARRIVYRAHEVVCAHRGFTVKACFECWSEALDAPDSSGSLSLLDKWGCGHV